MSRVVIQSGDIYSTFIIARGTFSVGEITPEMFLRLPDGRKVWIGAGKVVEVENV